MGCGEFSYDNRETCTTKVPTSCSPYTGVVNELIEDKLPACKPNANDIFKALQEVIQEIKDKLGDNTTLDNKCVSFNEATATQKEINQALIDKLCALETALADFEPVIDPATIRLVIDILCLQNEECEPPADYSIQELFELLITAYCGLLTRVQNIETLLNI